MSHPPPRLGRRGRRRRVAPVTQSRRRRLARRRRRSRQGWKFWRRWTVSGARGACGNTRARTRGGWGGAGWGSSRRLLFLTKPRSPGPLAGLALSATRTPFLPFHNCLRPCLKRKSPRCCISSESPNVLHFLRAPRSLEGGLCCWKEGVGCNSRVTFERNVSPCPEEFSANTLYSLVTCTRNVDSIPRYHNSSIVGLSCHRRQRSSPFTFSSFVRPWLLSSSSPP